MRFVFPLATLLVAGVSIWPDVRPLPLHSGFCTFGFCRFDQIFSRIDAQGMNVSSVGFLLNRDPVNPLVWCTYGEQLAADGRTEEAARAFEQAVTLGPGMSPVLMRAANFDFSHARLEQAGILANRILTQTDAFDQILFSYLTGASLARAIPANPRPAKAWLAWMRSHGSDQALLDTWSWMEKNHLADRKSALDTTWTLWNRGSLRTARAVWCDWMGPSASACLHPGLENPRFEKEPSGAPFDWTLTSSPSVQIVRDDGIEIRFSGTENVNFTQMHQFAAVGPGRYRISYEVSATGLTTDQRPLFRVFDPVNAARLNVETPPLEETMPRSRASLDFAVRPGTEVVQVQIERRASRRFDNKIAGTLHIYQVLLTPIS